MISLQGNSNMVLSDSVDYFKLWHWHSCFERGSAWSGQFPPHWHFLSASPLWTDDSIEQFSQFCVCNSSSSNEFHALCFILRPHSSRWWKWEVARHRRLINHHHDESQPGTATCPAAIDKGLGIRLSVNVILRKILKSSKGQIYHVKQGK